MPLNNNRVYGTVTKANQRMAIKKANNNRKRRELSNKIRSLETELNYLNRNGGLWSRARAKWIRGRIEKLKAERYRYGYTNSYNNTPAKVNGFNVPYNNLPMAVNANYYRRR